MEEIHFFYKNFEYRVEKMCAVLLSPIEADMPNKLTKGDSLWIKEQGYGKGQWD